ncbi:MAG: NUDIX domain-containing protein [Nanoarchaeota archaeon]|nr:NUDIX domain-containing protein [Nanoarchaeota archaeon]
MEKKEEFQVALLGIIFDPEKKKILIGRREKDPHIPELTWSFPGGRITPGEDVEETLKERIKKKTGLEIENLGSVYSRIPPEKKDLLLIYFLCEVTGGKEEKADDLLELKWVDPEELEEHFTTSFHPHVKEYILNLK